MESIIAAVHANNGTLTTVSVEPNLDIMIERLERTVQVMIVDRETETFVFDREYHRPGWAVTSIRRYLAGRALKEHPADKAPAMETEAEKDAAPAPESSRGSIWSDVPVAVKQVAKFTRLGRTVTVEVLPPTDDTHDIVVHWDQQMLRYSFEDERVAKMEGRKIAQMLLDGMH
jgi:hypothetical protein